MSRLNASDFEKASKMWASGDFTLDELSEKFDITPGALHKRFKKAGIEKGEAREKLQEAISQSLESQAKEKAAELMQLASQIKELHLKGSMSISKRILYEINQATQKHKPIASIRDDIKTLNDASKGLASNYAIAEKVLRLNDEETPDDEIPDLVVRRMNDDDVKRLRDEQSREIEEMTAGFSGNDLSADDLTKSPQDIVTEDAEDAGED